MALDYKKCKKQDNVNNEDRNTKKGTVKSVMKKLNKV